MSLEETDRWTKYRQDAHVTESFRFLFSIAAKKITFSSNRHYRTDKVNYGVAAPLNIKIDKVFLVLYCFFIRDISLANHILDVVLTRTTH